MPQPLNRPLRVFLCHSSHDKPIVRDLYRKLTAEGWIDVWFDEEKLFPGQDWNLEIEKAVEAADAILVCISRESITREGYIQRELRIVLDYASYKPDGTLYVIPIRLEDCELPRRLRLWQYADYFPEPDRDQAYQRLLASLRMRAGSLLILNPNPIAARSNFSKQNIEAVLHSPPLTDGSTANIAKRATFGGLEFLCVSAGPFLMGSKVDNPLADEDEKPQSYVDIPYDYWIGRFPVTNEQYDAFCKSSGTRHPVNNWEEKRNHPVSYIRWKEDAQAYIRWLNEQGWFLPQGLVFRLPTEAEWEKAARGTTGREWPWGNEFDNNKCNTSEEGTAPVGRYSPQGDSPYGCSDMASNVWEWTLSVMKHYPYNPRDGRENLQTQGPRVLRGGSFTHDNLSGRCAYRRVYKSINLFTHVIGFRVAVSVKLS